MKVTVEAAGHTYTFQDNDPPRDPDQLATLMRLFPDLMFGYSGGWRQYLRVSWRDLNGKMHYGELSNMADTTTIIKGIRSILAGT